MLLRFFIALTRFEFIGGQEITMKFRLSVQANYVFRSWQTDDWSVLVALAAISAEPEAIEEFYTAVSRYLPNHRWHETGDPGSLVPS